MPALSPTMTQGNISEWKLEEGDAIAAGDVVADIETDKATMALESMEDGFLAKISQPSGAQDLPVGTVLGVMVEDAADVPAFADYVAPAAPSTTADPDPAPTASPVSPGSSARAGDPADLFGGRMWPSVRRLLAESGIDPRTIVPSGPRGALVKGDVLAAMGLCDPPATTGARATSTARKTAPTPTPTPASAPPSPNPEQEWDDLRVTNVRKVIASRLLESKTLSPHHYVSAEVSLEGVASLRAGLKAQGERASVNDCVLYAVSRALESSPKVRATWDDAAGRANTASSVDVSVAVASPTGLITPVVRDASKMTLSEIGGAVRELAGRAREGKLKPHEYAGGCFSVSNLGMFAVDRFEAILNPPQGAIMAVGRGADRARLGADGAVTSEATMTVTVSADARVVDEADVAAFLEAFREQIEAPEEKGWAL
jgi:pyruvate dehydrogenase E2 component (dihydrolipoamide acetyltransferase)